MSKFINTHPGELLVEEFLKPMGITAYRLAKETNLPTQRINEIVNKKRGITAETDLRLCKFFGLSEGYWLRVQLSYDLREAKHAIGKKVDAEVHQYAGVGQLQEA